MGYLINTLMLFTLSTSLVYGGSLLSNLRYGLVLVNQTESLELDTGSSISTDSNTAAGLGVFAEKYYRQKYRFTGTVDFVSHPGNTTISGTLSGDYLYPINGRTALFAGLAVGGAGQKYDGGSLSDMSFAPVYGGQLGALVFINSHLTLDMGYRLRATALEAKITGTTSTMTTTSLDELYLGFVLGF